MILWTLLCILVEWVGLSDLPSNEDVYDSIGTVIGLGAIVFVWLIPTIGLAIIAYFVRPRPPVQIVYIKEPPSR